MERQEAWHPLRYMETASGVWQLPSCCYAYRVQYFTGTVKNFCHRKLRVIILYGQGLQELCTDERVATRRLGPKNFKKLRAKLHELETALSVTELVSGRPHPLKGDRAGQFSLRLDGACRLVFEPVPHPPPMLEAGGIAWSQVTSIRIVFIGDYHD